MLTFTYLGHFAIYWQEQIIDDFSSSTVEALLAYVALHPKQPFSRDFLTSFLYADLPQRKARQNFRKTLSRLRRSFNDEKRPACDQILHITKDTITFDPQVPYQLDVVEFEKGWQLAQTSDTAEIERSRHVSHLLRQATSWYKGHFLQDLSIDSASFEEWVFHQRERLHQFMLTALHRLAQHAHTIGAFEQMLDYAQQQVALEPWYEEAHYQIMLALAALGQRTAALKQYEQCCQQLDKHLGVTPAAPTVHLFQQLARATDEITLFHKRDDLPPHNLPGMIAPLIGRQQQLEQVLDLLGDPHVRLVTILGEGGVGKTRLARATAVRLAGLARFLPESPFQDGVWWISLAELSVSATSKEGENVLATHILNGLGVTGQDKRSPTAVLTDYLRQRQLLLVLDNYEHIIGTTHLLSQLLQACPQVKLLVTTRATLRLQAEHIFVLHGLFVPPTPPIPSTKALHSQPVRDSALSLFAEVATRTTGQTWRLTADNAPLVHRLCQLVRGNPLAIELAASWLRYLPLAQVLAELENNLDILATRQHDLPERHRSIRAVFDYSWQLLTPAEQDLLQVLALMRMPCALEAMHTILNGLPTHGRVLSLWQTRQTLLSLIDHSLVWLEEESGYYHMHPLLQQFGQEQAAANVSGWLLPPDVNHDHDGLAFLHGLHADFFLSWLAAREADLHGPAPHAAVAEITAVWDDLRLAWHTASTQARLTALRQASPSLTRYLNLRAAHFEGEALWRALVEEIDQWPTAVRDSAAGRQLQEQALGWLASFMVQLYNDEAVQEIIGRALQAKDSPTLCRAHLAQAFLCRKIGQWPQAFQHLQTAQELAQVQDDPRLLIEVLMRHEPYHTNSLDHIEEALARAQDLHDSYLCLTVTIRLGGGAFFMGRQNRARTAWENALALSKAYHSPIREALILNNLGDIYRFFGDYQRARQVQEESLRLAQDIGHQQLQMSVLEGLTRTYTSLRLYEQAEETVETCVALCLAQQAWGIHVFALNARGHLHRQQGDFVAAAQAYRQTIASVTVNSDLEHVLLETYAGLAEMALAEGRRQDAHTAVIEFCALYERIPLEHYLDVAWMMTVVARVLRAHHDPAADQYRAQARQYVTRRLQTLSTEPQLRQRYLAHISPRFQHETFAT